MISQSCSDRFAFLHGELDGIVVADQIKAGSCWKLWTDTQSGTDFIKRALLNDWDNIVMVSLNLPIHYVLCKGKDVLASGEVNAFVYVISLIADRF